MRIHLHITLVCICIYVDSKHLDFNIFNIDFNNLNKNILIHVTLGIALSILQTAGEN